MNGEPVTGPNVKLPVYIEENTQNATGYFYPVAVMFKLFGISITSVRYVSVFFGVLSVAAFYFLCRWLFGAPLGLFLAAALATLRWHMNFSRIGFLGIMTLCLEIPVLYFLLRGMKEKGSALVAKFHPGLFAGAVALAVLRGALSFTRLPYGIEALIGLLMGVPLLAYAWAARKDRRARYLMAAALMLALAMYSYIAARLLVIAVLLLVAHALVFEEELERRQKALLALFLGALVLGAALMVFGSTLEPWSETGRPTHAVKILGKVLVGLSAVPALLLFLSMRRRLASWGRPLGLALGLGLVAAGPLYGYTLAHMKEVNARSDRVSIFNDREYDRRSWGTKLIEEIPLTMGMYNVRGDGNPRHNLPGEIMLNPFWAAFFAMGVFFCLFRLRDERSWLVLSFWQVNLIAGYYSIEAPQAYRSIGAIPVVLIGAGLALERGLVAMRRLLERDWWMGAVPLLACLLGFGALYEISTYFQRQPEHPGVWAEFSASEYMMGRDLKALQPGTRGLLRPDWADSYTFRFMTYPERNYQYFDLTKHVPIREPMEGVQKYYYALGASQKPLAGILKSYYPHGVYNEEKHPKTGELLYWSFVVGADEVKKAQHSGGGLRGQYFQDIPKDMNKPWEGPHWSKAAKKLDQVDPFLLFDWTVSPVPGYFSAVWTGRIHIPKGGRTNFWLNSNSYGRLEIDGRKVIEVPYDPPAQAPSEGSAELSAGWHEIKVLYFEARNYSRLGLEWRIPGGEREIVPSTALSPQ